MIVNMPFLHRMRAATAKTPEPREIAAWDKEFISLAELTTSDFEQGAELGATRTIVADGRHWASLTELYPNSSYLGPDTDPIEYALSCLAIAVDCSRFFAVERERIPQTSIMQKPPSVELIHTSERELNVAKLTEWVSDNLVAVDGRPFVRVKEPTVYFDIVGPFGLEKCFMTLKLSKLVPEPYNDYEHGVMATISGRHELLDVAKNLLKTDGRMMRFDNEIASSNFKSMTSSAEDAADIARRSLANMAKQMTWARNRDTVPERLLKAMKGMFRGARREFDDDELDHIAELVACDVENLSFPKDVMARMILERWYQRPIDLKIDRQTTGGRHGHVGCLR